MPAGQSDKLGSVLASYLRDATGTHATALATIDVVIALSTVAAQISAIIGRGPLSHDLGHKTGCLNVDGDAQTGIDVLANTLIVEALKHTATRYFASEEEDAILTLSRNGVLAVAVDPVDGTSNLDANISIGTIFTIYPVSERGATASFLRRGREQIASGYFVYGPHTALVLTLGAGVDLFVLDRTTASFRLVHHRLAIPASATEFAINASNHRHWFKPVKAFIEDCLAGSDGPRGRDFNMRWVASLVAETHRIFLRGGIFLYPADRRSGYEQGRLRYLYEAAPIAFLVEQAHGGAIDGTQPILDKTPHDLHARTPLIFGSSETVARVLRYHNDPNLHRDESPLFEERGLFRG